MTIPTNGTPVPNEATTPASTTDGGALAGWQSTHIGRSFSGHYIEDDCPCPQQQCGLVLVSDAHPDCLHHPVGRAKTIRQSHPATNCLGGVA